MAEAFLEHALELKPELKTLDRLGSALRTADPGRPRFSFGFQFQSVFQEGFRHLAGTAKSVQGAGLLLMLLTIGLLISPSLYHQIVHDGESRLDALNVATWFAGASLLPLTLGLAASAFVVFRACIREATPVSSPAACSGWWRCRCYMGLVLS